jgi:hypothetical protein
MTDEWYIFSGADIEHFIEADSNHVEDDWN